MGVDALSKRAGGAFVASIVPVLTGAGSLPSPMPASLLSLAYKTEKRIREAQEGRPKCDAIWPQGTLARGSLYGMAFSPCHNPFRKSAVPHGFSRL